MLKHIPLKKSLQTGNCSTPSKLEMLKRLSITILACAAIWAASSTPSCADSYHITKVKNGVYMVKDLETKKTVYVRDPKAYMQHKFKSRRADGFGKEINHSTFAKGSTPVADTAKAAAETASYAADAAYNVTNTVPSWRKYTGPLRSLFGGNSKKQQP
jgi:hypothetical protein